MGGAIDDELREHRRHRPVLGGIADVVLDRTGRWRVDDDLVGVRVIRRSGLQVGDVRASADLGHGETAEQLPRGDLLEVLVVVALGAEAGDRPAEEPDLDPHLDEERQIDVTEHLEHRQRRADVPGSPGLVREPGLRPRQVHEPEQLAGRALAVVGDRKRLGRRGPLARCELGAHCVADLGPPPVEGSAKFGHR